MPVINETPGYRPGARQNFQIDEKNKSNTQPKLNQKGYEDRRNAAACFKNRHKREYWQADYVGIAVVEGLRDGDKVWINVKERVSRTGDKYLSVTLQRQGVRP